MSGKERRSLFGRGISKQTNGVKNVRQELIKSDYIWCSPGKRDATLKNTLERTLERTHETKNLGRT